MRIIYYDAGDVITMTVVMIMDFIGIMNWKMFVISKDLSWTMMLAKRVQLNPKMNPKYLIGVKRMMNRIGVDANPINCI